MRFSEKSFNEFIFSFFALRRTSHPPPLEDSLSGPLSVPRPQYFCRMVPLLRTLSPPLGNLIECRCGQEESSRSLPARYLFYLFYQSYLDELSYPDSVGLLSRMPWEARCLIGSMEISDVDLLVIEEVLTGELGPQRRSPHSRSSVSGHHTQSPNGS